MQMRATGLLGLTSMPLAYGTNLSTAVTTRIPCTRRIPHTLTVLKLLSSVFAGLDRPHSTSVAILTAGPDSKFCSL
jgi:hypothetical protein